MKIILFKILLNQFLKGSLNSNEEQVLNVFVDEMQKEGFNENDVKFNLALKNKIHNKVHNEVRSKIRVLKISKIAVVAVLIVGISFAFGNDLFNKSNYIKEITHKGEIKTIWLSDSTQVVLNSDSELRYKKQFSGSKREVELKGEAYFIVYRDVEKPFIVLSSNLKTEVLGTRFNVSNYDNETARVTVVSGKVSVSDITRQRSVILTKNKYAKFVDNKLITNTVNANQHISWIEGKFEFKNATLIEVVNILNHHFKSVIVIDEHLIGFNKKITGTYQKNNVSDILKSIEFIYDIKYKIENDTIKLFANPLKK